MISFLVGTFHRLMMLDITGVQGTETMITRVGPFVLTKEVTIPDVISTVAIVVAAIKFIGLTTIWKNRLDTLWVAMMGKGPQDQENFFNRFSIVEQRVQEMWDRLDFAKLR